MTFGESDLYYTTYDYDKTASIYGIHYGATTVSQDQNLRIVKIPKFINSYGKRYKVTSVNVYSELSSYYKKAKKLVVPRAAGYVSAPYGIEVEYYD